MTNAANKAGRFDKAVEGYISLVLNQPTIAGQYRPTVPHPGSPYLDGAAGGILRRRRRHFAGQTPQQQSACCPCFWKSIAPQ